MAHEISTPLLLSLSLLSLAACNPGGTEPTKTGPTKPEPTKIEPTKIDPIKEPGIKEPPIKQPADQCRPPAKSKDECPSSRRVGLFQGDCPPVYTGELPKTKGSWNVEPMFSVKGNRYCRYVWSGDPSAVTPLPKDLASKLGPDCRVYAQSPMAAALAGSYERAFGEGTQPLTSVPEFGNPVVIAVVDTAPEDTRRGQSPHGQAISAIAATLAAGCAPGLGDDGCARSVITELGLPQTRTGPDPDLGGFYGYQSELAEGIMRALDRVPNDDRKLVLNLAVGWEPVAGEFGSQSSAVAAVRDAIAIAHCRGAVIISASGNQPPGNACATQATAPGTWASEPGWTAAQCSGLGLIAGDIRLPSPLHAYHPFLHAATPVGWDAGNLADFREGSNARIAVTGFAGAATRGSTNYGPMTGSSISTAALSGIAALVWSYFPDISADAVMQAIYESGTPTSRTATLSLPQLQATNQLSALVQHQVTACGALSYACSNWQNYTMAHGPNPAAQPMVCATLVDVCPAARATSVDASAWATDFDNALAQLDPSLQQRIDGPVWTAIKCVGCNQQPRFVMLPPGVSQEPADPGWVVPQPEVPPCPICKIKKPSTQLFLSLDPSYDGFTLVSMSVKLTDQNGANETLYYQPAMLPQLSSTTVQTVTDPELATVGTGTGALPPVRAYVRMIFDNAGTTVVAGNQIPITN